VDSRSLRIALLSYRSLPTSGGQGVYIRHLSRELIGLGHQVHVFSGPPYPELVDGVELTELPSLELWREPDPFRIPRPSEFKSLIDVVEFAHTATGAFSEPLSGTLRMWRALRPGKGATAQPPPFDIVHDNQSLGYGLLGLRRSLEQYGIPVVATIHHPITVDRRLSLAAARGIRKNVGLRRFYSFLPMQTRVASRLDGVLTVSSISERDIQKELGVPGEMMHTVPLGVEPDVFYPDPAAAVPGRIVVVTSADVPLKGLLVLLDALAKLRTEHENAHLVCVGRATPGGPTDRRIDELGLRDAVTFRHGLPQDELVQLLQSAQVAVVPSIYEGFSLPAIEELACGLPLVATEVGALPELVGPDGESGLLVPPGDAEALAVALSTLFDDPELRARMGAAARRRVCERFTWQATAAATAEWYAERIERVKSQQAAAGTGSC
jgi:glycosyltransferase involved in cell wall biosynthesis